MMEERKKQLPDEIITTAVFSGLFGLVAYVSSLFLYLIFWLDEIISYFTHFFYVIWISCALSIIFGLYAYLKKQNMLSFLGILVSILALIITASLYLLK